MSQGGPLFTIGPKARHKVVDQRIQGKAPFVDSTEYQRGHKGFTHRHQQETVCVSCGSLRSYGSECPAVGNLATTSDNNTGTKVELLVDIALDCRIETRKCAFIKAR